MTDETDPLAAVRQQFDRAEGIAPVEGLAPPDPGKTPHPENGRWSGEDPGPQPDGNLPDDPDQMFEARMRRAAELPMNDFGNGQRLVIHFGDDLMFVPRVGWFVWDGARWAKDPDRLEVRRRAQALAPLILEEIDWIEKSPRIAGLLQRQVELRVERRRLEDLPEAERAEDHDKELRQIDSRLDVVAKGLAGYQKSIDRIRTHAKNAGNSGPLLHMIEEAEPTLAVPLEDLDAAPLDVCCETGVLRFSKMDLRAEGAGVSAEVELIPHARDQRNTKQVAAPYDPEARAPRFEAFLQEVQPDLEMRQFLQRWFGLSMTALPVQKLAFFHGNGANGKSVLVDLMAKILADYGATVRIESLTGTARRGGGDATPDLIPLIGARFARTSEPDQGTRLQEGLIKELTGGEPIMVRALHSDFVEIRPIFKLTMSGNHKPEIRGTDDGIWRRVMMVPWPVTIPEARRNPRLVEDLFEERAGILNWLVEGLQAYLEGGLAPPKVVTEATEEYRQDSDPLGQFLAGCFAMTGDATDTITASEMVNAFAFFLMERGEAPWKPTTVSRQLATKVRTWTHPETGRGFGKSKSSISQYHGLTFTDAFRRRWDDAPKDVQGRPLAARNATPDPADGQ